MKIYVAVRDDWSVKVNVLQPQDPSRSDSKTIAFALHPRWDLVKHADDFGWGKDNCSASQLALALLADHFGLVDGNQIARYNLQTHPPASQDTDSEALLSIINRVMSLYPLFAAQVVSRVPLFQMHWELTSADIEKWLKSLDGKIE